jgi:hypothetical protein
VLARIEGPVLAVPDRHAAAEGWVTLLGAEHDLDDRVEGLGAERSRYRLGNGWVDFLEPAGAGPVADAVGRRGAHLYAVGVTSPDVNSLATHLRACDVELLEEGGQAWVGSSAQHAHGFVVAISADVPREPIGLIDTFYEATNLVHDQNAVVSLYAHLFGLDASTFCPIDSSHYGYDGTLTLFHPDRLHRFEVITPNDSATTMGRFFAKVGPSLYMMFAETGMLDEIIGRLEEHGAGHTTERGSVFVHPPALGGMMLGVSRRTLAWLWSGHPERVEAR